MSDFKRIKKSSSSSAEHFKNRHRFEHWYIDNQVYFLTARCRDKFPAFASAQAKEVFWNRFEHYAAEFGFMPWVTSLLDNHYHTLGYLGVGENLGKMMQRIHGSVAKLVNDTLAERRVPFWSEKGHRDYFDGAIRDEIQCRRAYKYTLRQSNTSRHCERLARLCAHSRTHRFGSRREAGVGTQGVLRRRPLQAIPKPEAALDSPSAYRHGPRIGLVA
jgi:hypothetical protein